MEDRFKGITKRLLLSILAVGFGSSFLYGYNIGVINAPQTVMGDWIRSVECSRISDSDPATTEIRESNATAVWCSELAGKQRERMFKENQKLNALWTAIASLFTVGGFLGSLMSPPIVRRIGRKKALLINNITGILAAVLLASSYFLSSYEMLMAGRFVAGLNGGVTSAVSPLYMTEIPPLELRGTLGGLHQFFIVFAIWISQILGMPMVLGNSSLWPVLFGLGLVPSVIQLVLLPFCPESPKFFYLNKNKKHKAEKAMQKLRTSDTLEDEMNKLQEEKEDIEDDDFMTMWDILRDKALRKAAIVAIIITSSGQLSGHGTVVYYSTSIFRSSGLSGNSAIYATIGMGGVYALSTFLTAAIVDRVGRRILMLISIAGMLVLSCLLTLFIALFQAHESGSGSDYTWASYASMSCVFLHTVLYSLGPGTIPAFLVSELFPQTSRGAATGLALATNWMSALIVVVAFPFVQVAIEAYSFLIFVGLLLFYLVFTYFKIPETRGRETKENLRKLTGDESAAHDAA